MSSSTAQRWDELKPLLRLDGKGCKEFLHGQTSADVKTSEVNNLLPSCWLTTTGRIKALLEIRLDDQGADVVVLAGDSDALAQGFEQVIFPTDHVRLQPLRSIRRLQVMEAIKAEHQPKVAWLHPDAELPSTWASREPASLDQVERWRIEQGLPLGTGELNGETNPFELGLAAWMSLSKGCYLGQEAIAKLARSAETTKQLRCWQSDQPIPAGKNLIIPGSSANESKRAGRITSAIAFTDPKGEISIGSIGLALVRHQALHADELVVAEDSSKVRLSIPPGWISPTASN